ncbi:hypothetical protein Tco_0800395 [Tanacetum coccineum]|uniref:Uncharacterized protein n=1 Tax=Tanacetum coccineum TaxID=301880 RepID=A0ABQ4ZWB1_9ASTR
MNYVLHHQRPGLSKSIDSNILFDIDGRTLLLGRAEFFLVTGFACGIVVFPEYLDDNITPFVRRVFLDKLKKLEKKKAGLGKAAKGKVAQPSDKGDKDSVTNEDLGELVHDKAPKGKAAQPSDKGDKDSVMIEDLGELVHKDEKWKKLSVDDFVRVCLLYMCELIFRGQEDKKVVPTFMLRLVEDLAAWDDFP